MRKGRPRGEKAGPSGLSVPRNLEQPTRVPLDASKRRAYAAAGGSVREAEEAGPGSAACREPPEKVLRRLEGLWVGGSALSGGRRYSQGYQDGCWGLIMEALPFG